MPSTMAIICVILEPAARKYRDYVFDKGDSSGFVEATRALGYSKLRSN